MKIKVDYTIIENGVDEYLIITTEDSKLIRLNSVAYFLWTLLEKELSQDTICKQMSENYKISENDAMEYVQQFKCKMELAGII